MNLNHSPGQERKNRMKRERRCSTSALSIQAFLECERKLWKTSDSICVIQCHTTIRKKTSSMSSDRAKLSTPMYQTAAAVAAFGKAKHIVKKKLSNGSSDVTQTEASFSTIVSSLSCCTGQVANVNMSVLTCDIWPSMRPAQRNCTTSSSSRLGCAPQRCAMRLSTPTQPWHSGGGSLCCPCSKHSGVLFCSTSRSRWVMADMVRFCAMCSSAGPFWYVCAR
mmetsp:Transcript_105032/g.338682  ORF Transcript_105032/g.338682 Transcript_105032/m.338682 type:complete len:222 (+) Transcript_105032:261-926(+)